MDFNLNVVTYTCAGFFSGALILPFSLRESLSHIPFTLSLVLLLGLLPCVAAHAAGDAARGRYNWEYTCQHCHGDPQPGNKPAFSDYDDTANKLSVYASDPAAITKAANEGYIVPDGNSNDKVEPGKSTNIPMGTWAGMAPNRLGLGTTPTQYAIDFSAYFASLFAVPGAPNIVSVSPGNGLASVSFTAPKSDLTIVAYTVTANPGGITARGAASPVTVTGLTNGNKYTFTVSATSNAGTGMSSSSSNPVTLAVPTIPVVTHTAPPVGNTAVNGSAVARIVTPPKSVPVSASARLAPTPVPVVQNGTAPSLSGSPDHAPQAAGLPVPIIKYAKAGNAQARLFFDPPSGSTGITGYTVTVLSRGIPTGMKATGLKSPITVNGLTNGTDYTFTITANSSSGTSAASLPSPSVTPLRILGD